MEKITSVNLADEMKTAYGDYAMAVLIGRAIPDLYDGLKPVTRRVLTAMKWLNLKPDARYMKAARVSGETMGKLHPHGGAYGAMVTASQPWTNNHPLIDGHGNWGSPTDGPAAERYTEAKLTSYAWDSLLQDTSTWVTRPNYDGSMQEPTQLNSKLPNLLLNGGSGIGVGYATNVPTHNLRGIAAALPLVLEGKVAEATKHLVPDWPTGCEVVKDEGLLEYLNTGRGSIRLRAKVEEETVDYGKRAKRTQLVFTALPIHVNTEQVGEQIKNALEKGQITTVADVRDETDMNGTRFAVVLRANASAQLAKDEIFKYTSLDTKFGANNLAIDGTKPVQYGPYKVLERWLEWRDGRLVASFKQELSERRRRLEIVQGLVSALGMIDAVIDEIRRSKDKATARTRLMALDFTEVQANAILDMRLSQLTRLDEKDLKAESRQVQTRIKALIKFNSSSKLRQQYVIDEISELAERYGNARRSEIIEPPAEAKGMVVKVGRKKVEVAKPRFVKIDNKTGVVTQLRKMTRGCTVIDRDDKFVFVTDDGKFRKTPSSYKGPLGDNPTKVLFQSKVSSLPDHPLVAVWELDNGVYANVIPWEALTKTTSKGKAWLPDGAKLISLGGTYTLKMSGRKRDKVIGINTVKTRSVGGRGSKIANVEDLA